MEVLLAVKKCVESLMRMNCVTDASYVRLKYSFKLFVKLRNYGMISVAGFSRIKLQLQSIVLYLRKQQSLSLPII